MNDEVEVIQSQVLCHNPLLPGLPDHALLCREISEYTIFNMSYFYWIKFL